MYKIIIQPKTEKNLLRIPFQSRERISKVINEDILLKDGVFYALLHYRTQ